MEDSPPLLHFELGVLAALMCSGTPLIEHRISKIPDYLKKVNEQAYTPKVISIGPVHHANPNLQAMEKYKHRYLKVLNERTDLDLLRRTIGEMKDGIRDFYKEIDLLYDDAELMDMILLDTTFILEFFRKIAYGPWGEEDLRIERQKMIILSDLVLLENQVPFFVLEKLFCVFITAYPYLSEPDLTSLTFKCFDFRNLQEKKPEKMKIFHFTHLMRTFQLPDRLQGGRVDELVTLKHSASQLHDAGVKLMVKTPSKGLLDIEYKDGVLKIPRLNLYDDTEVLFRNIMAFEEFHSREVIQFMDYCVFMDSLVNTAEDIKVLCDNGILVNYLGDENSAASVFNNLNRDIFVPGFHKHFVDICTGLNEFCKKPWHRWKATLRHQYFSSPWRAASTIAAIILLLLTFIQTVCSIVK